MTRRHIFAALIALLAGCTGANGRSGGGRTLSAGSIVPVGSASVGGVFVRVTPLATPRVHHTGTLLASGRVLLVGGQSGAQTVTATTEIFDPVTGGVIAGPSLNVPRMRHAAIALPSGRVLIVGGQSDVVGRWTLASTEIYDPVAGTFGLGPSLSSPRSGPAVAAFRGANGTTDLLVAGGAAYQSGLLASLATADIFLSLSGTVTPVPAVMAQDRYGASALALPGGQVLVAGGYTQLPSFSRAASSELYDPVAQRFVSVPSGQRRAEAALVQAGSVFFLGGTDGSLPLASVEAFGGPSWQPATPLLHARRGVAAAALPGRALVVGGWDGSGALASCEVVGGFAAPSLNSARAWATATALANGNVLVAGGLDSSNGILSSLEVYSPSGALVPGATTNAGTVAPGGPLGGAPGVASAVNVTALVPSTGVPGTVVTIGGTGFDPLAANDAVSFNGVPALVAAVDVSNPLAEALQVVVPANATTGPVSVTVNGQTSPQAPFFTVAGGLNATPTILNVTPAAGPVFMPVSISGQGFGPSPSVTFNGVPAASIVSLSTKALPLIGQVSELVVLVPPGATTGPLVVSNGTLSAPPVSFVVQ